MARIDTSMIDGYENMTAEEKLSALESFEYEDSGEENRIKKRLIGRKSTMLFFRRMKGRDRLAKKKPNNSGQELQSLNVEKVLPNTRPTCFLPALMINLLTRPHR